MDGWERREKRFEAEKEKGEQRIDFCKLLLLTFPPLPAAPFLFSLLPSSSQQPRSLRRKNFVAMPSLSWEERQSARAE